MAETPSHIRAKNAIINGSFVVDVATSWEPLTFLISKDNGSTYTETSATSETIEEGTKRWSVPCENTDYVKLVRGGSAPV